MTTRDVAARLSDIDRELRFVNDSYNYVSSVVTPLLANVSGSQTELDNAQQVNHVHVYLKPLYSHTLYQIRHCTTCSIVLLWYLRTANW